MLPSLPVPEFEQAGAWIDPAYFDDATRARLLDLLREGKIVGNDAEAFIGWCRDFAQSLELGADGHFTPAGMKNQLERLATAMRGAQQALGLERLHADAVEYLSSLLTHAALSDEAAVEIGPAARRLIADGDAAAALRAVFEGLQAIEAVARHAASTIEARPGFDIREQRGRQLVDLVLQAYKGRFAALPPAALDSWFSSAMGEVGRRAGLICGPKVCRAGVIAARG